MNRPTLPERSLSALASTLLLLLLANSVALTAQEGGDASQLQAEMDREVDTQPSQTSFRLTETIGGKVAATLGVKAYDPDQSIHSFELDFGADQAARCFLWETELSVAGLLDRQSQQVKAGLGENTQWRVFGFDADASGGIPLLGIRWLYQIQGEEGTTVGLFKMYAAAPGSTTLLCFHDRLGYIKSFASLFRDLVAGLEVPPSDEPAPDTRDISIVTMFDMQVGFVEDSLTRVGDQIQIVSESALLVPTSGTDIMSSDEASVELSNLDGSLISAVLAEGPNLEVRTRLEVQRTDDGDWRASGIRNGEDFEARFAGDPLSQYGTILKTLQAAGDPDRRAITFPRWDDNDPGQLSSATVTVNDPGPPIRATMNMPEIEATATLDADGRAISIRSVADGVDIAIDRVFKEGSLPGTSDAEPEG